MILISYELTNEEWQAFLTTTLLCDKADGIADLCGKFLQCMADILAYDQAAILFFTNKQEKMTSPAQIGCANDFVEEYLQHFFRMDYLSWLYYQDTASVFKESDYFNHDAKKKLAFYEDFLQKHNIEYRCCFNIVTDHKTLGLVSLYRSEQSGDFSDRELWLISRLQEYFMTALQKACEYEKLKTGAKFNTFIYDSISDGIFLLNKNYEMTYANKAAQSILFDVGRRSLDGDKDIVSYISETCYKLFMNYLLYGKKEDALCLREAWDEMNFSFHLVDYDPDWAASNMEFTVVVKSRATDITPSLTRESFGSGEEDDYTSMFLYLLFAKYGLTKRESELAGLVINGKSNADISKELYISVSTVKSHLQNIFRKLKIRNRSQLALLCFKYYNDEEFRESFSLGDYADKDKEAMPEAKTE